jgi:hypothetical protein
MEECSLCHGFVFILQAFITESGEIICEGCRKRIEEANSKRDA